MLITINDNYVHDHPKFWQAIRNRAPVNCLYAFSTFFEKEFEQSDFYQIFNSADTNGFNFGRVLSQDLLNEVDSEINFLDWMTRSYPQFQHWVTHTLTRRMSSLNIDLTYDQVITKLKNLKLIDIVNKDIHNSFLDVTSGEAQTLCLKRHDISLNYRSLNKIGTLNDLEVFSSMPEGVSNTLDFDNILVNEAYITNKVNHLPDAPISKPFYTHYKWRNQNPTLSYINSIATSSYSLNQITDFLLANPSFSAGDPKSTFPDIQIWSSDSFNSIFPNLENTISAFYCPAFFNSKSNKPICFREIKISMLKSRKGIFVPILQKVQTFTKDFETKDIYLLQLINIDNKNTCFNQVIFSRSRPRTTIKEFLSYLYLYDSLYFSDPEARVRAIQNLYKNILPLNTKIKDTVHSSTLGFLNVLKDNAESFKVKVDGFKSEPSLSEETVSLLGSSPKINDNLKKRELKLKAALEKKKNQYFNLLDKAKENYRTNIFPEARLKINLLFLEFSKNELSSSPTKQSLSEFTKYFFLQQENTQKIQKEISNSFKNNSYQEDLFFKNLSNQDIIINKIEFANNKRTYSLNSNNPNLDTSEFFTQTKDLKLLSITFSTTKPVKIYVDGKVSPKAVKIGGPYIVKLTRSSLEVGLAQPKSFFGTKVNSGMTRIWIHPHSNTMSLDTYLRPQQYFQSACLGEATSLIYNAFDQNSIKLALLGAMTWLTSANSADVWGKNYDTFPEYSDFAFEDVVNDEISSSEVSDFLNQESESIDLENFSSEQQLPLDQPEEPPLEINEPILPIPLPPEVIQEQQEPEALNESLDISSEPTAPLPQPVQEEQVENIPPESTSSTVWSADQFTEQQSNYTPYRLPY